MNSSLAIRSTRRLRLPPVETAGATKSAHSPTCRSVLLLTLRKCRDIKQYVRGAAAEYEKTLQRALPAVFKRVRAHDRRHAFRRRLSAVGMSREDRQDLLGHKSGRMTTH